MSLQKVTALTLLDLSTTCDMIDHSLLNASLFGLQSLLQLWRGLKFYRQNHSFYVSIENCKSSKYQLLYRVPQGSVLSPLFFILYSIHHSTQHFLSHPNSINSLQMILSFSYLSLQSNLLSISLTSNKLSL
jgi:hypothetical protein